MNHAFDPHFQRERFPSLKRIVDGKPAVFLDGPGGIQTPELVIEAVASYLSSSNANLGGAFATSRESDEVVDQAREAMADFFNARRPEEITFGQNMTSLTFAVSRAISRQWRPGDEIVLTSLDHDANITPWIMAAEEKEVTVRWWDFDPHDCTLDIRKLEELLS